MASSIPEFYRNLLYCCADQFIETNGDIIPLRKSDNLQRKFQVNDIKILIPKKFNALPAYIVDASRWFKAIEQNTIETYLDTSTDFYNITKGNTIDIVNRMNINKLMFKLPYFCPLLGAISDNIIEERTRDPSLATLLTEKKITFTLLYYLIVQVILAIQKAQDKIGFVHGQLTPENIIIKNTQIESVVINIEDITYILSVNQYIPFIKNFSQTRTMSKSFGFSNTQNPTLFHPGQDLFKFIGTVLALVFTTNLTLYQDISWIGEYYGKDFFKFFPSDTYDTILKRYNNFDIDYANSFSNDRPFNMIKYMDNIKPKSVSETIKHRDKRVIRPKKLKTENTQDYLVINEPLIPSKGIRDHINLSIDPSTRSKIPESTYDSLLLDKFQAELTRNPLNKVELTVNYNFPLGYQYDGLDPINYDTVFFQVCERNNILSSNIDFIRQLSYTSTYYPYKPTVYLYEEKYRSKTNKNLIANMYLYKLYGISKFLQNGKTVPIGTAKILLKDYSAIVNMLKIIFPYINDFLDQNYNFVYNSLEQTINTLVESSTSGIYFPPSTLCQFKQVFLTDNIRLKELVGKTFFGWGASNEKTELLTEMERLIPVKNDVDVLLALRKFKKVEAEDRMNARSSSKLKDIKGILQNKLLMSRSLLGTNDVKYLDYGGSDGIISAEIARGLGISKANAFTADIEVWNNSLIEKKQIETINFVNLYEDQPLPFPDKYFSLITCQQVLHHIKNVDFVLSELSRICKGVLIIREHDCSTETDRMLIDIEHSLQEISLKENPNLQYLNTYQAWYKPKTTWAAMLADKGFKQVPTEIIQKPTPAKYYWNAFVAK